MTKSTVLVPAAVLLLFISAPAIAERHDHDAAKPPAATGNAPPGSLGESRHHDSGGAAAGSGGGSGGRTGGMPGTMGPTDRHGVIIETYRRDRSGSGGSAGRGAPSTVGGTIGTTAGHSVTIDMRHRDHTGFDRGATTDAHTGSTGGVTTFTGGVSDRTHRDRGFRNNTGVTVFAPHTHWGRHTNNHAFDQLRRVFNSRHRFHHGTYRRPNGWFWHRWTFGEFLPYIFFERQYWLNDWEDFDLDDPPPGTVWIRYGNDALLIDEDTGEVIEVVYDVFY